MIEIKIGVIVMCAICKLIGELWWHNAQRFIMPVVITVATCIIIHSWMAVLVLPMILPLCMGYSVYGKSDGFDRAVWLLLICLTEGLGLTISHHLPILFYAPWIILSAVWGGVTRNWWNVVIAPISGAIIGLMILFVR